MDETIAGVERHLSELLLDQHQDEREIRQLRWQVRQRAKVIEDISVQLDRLRDGA